MTATASLTGIQLRPRSTLATSGSELLPPARRRCAGATGLLVPAGDGEALAAACTRLLEFDAVCERLGAVAETRYAWPLLLDEHIEILGALPAAHADATG